MLWGFLLLLHRAVKPPSICDNSVKYLPCSSISPVCAICVFLGLQ